MMSRMLGGCPFLWGGFSRGFGPTTLHLAEIRFGLWQKSGLVCQPPPGIKSVDRAHSYYNYKRARVDLDVHLSLITLFSPTFQIIPQLFSNFFCWGGAPTVQGSTKSKCISPEQRPASIKKVFCNDGLGHLLPPNLELSRAAASKS